METNNYTPRLSPADPISAAQKQHNLKIKNRIAFRAKCKQQGLYNKLKKRKHANTCLDAILKLKVQALTQKLAARSDYKNNIHSMFYIKPDMKRSQSSFHQMSPIRRGGLW